MAKVVCDSCGTTFKYEVVKDMKNCPVCGELLCGELLCGEEGENTDIENGDLKADESENGLMYFSEIVEYQDAPEYSYVTIYCGECQEFNSMEPDKFDQLVDKEYVILKNDVVLICRGCGKEHKPRKILYKKRKRDAPLLPRCPVCNSLMLKRIKTSSKFLAAAVIGAFALPYNGKTFECQNCGYKF